MNYYVTKPIDRTALLATLRRWLPRNTETDHSKTSPERTSSTPAEVDTPTLDGINVANTLARLGLGFGSLRKMLIRFADGQGKTLDELRSAVAIGDAAAAARHAHSIAGAGGNLGADELRSAAKALEHAARNGGQNLETLLRSVDEHAARVFRSIDSLRDEPAVSSVPHRPIDLSKLREGLTRLESALKDSDVSASGDALAELDGIGAPADVATQLSLVRGCVDDYEYDEAAAAVARLLEGLEMTK
jgi:HPt (histidine-containing phosphotransfer) domain-containing protein